MKVKNGFTFIELLVVVTIVAVLMTIGALGYTNVNKRARDAKRKADLQSIRSALEICRSNTGVYPATIYDGNGDVSCSDGAVSLRETPKDPYGSGGTNYTYVRSSNTTYSVSCSFTGSVFETGGTCVYYNP